MPAAAATQIKENRELTIKEEKNKYWPTPIQDGSYQKEK